MSGAIQPPYIGRMIKQRGHEYKVVGWRDHRCENGRLAVMLNLEGRCAICGGAFRFEHVRSIRPYLTRTCRRHRGQYHPGAGEAKAAKAKKPAKPEEPPIDIFS